jgi:predicted RNase H-like HicB family nuclease
MRHRKSYKVRYELDETGWWLATVVDVKGCHTQGRTLDQAERRIREALALFVPEHSAREANLPALIALPRFARRSLSLANRRRAQATALAEQSRQALGSAARALSKAGLSLRDIGKLLEVTRQRAHQIIRHA